MTFDEKIKLARNPNTPEAKLVELSKDSSWLVRAAVGANLNAPKEVLIELSKDSDWRVRRTVGGNPNTPKEVFIELSKDSDWWVREPVGANPNTPEEVLVKLSKDSSDWVRRAVGVNPNTPEATLAKLSKDDEMIEQEENTIQNSAPKVYQAIVNVSKAIGQKGIQKTQRNERDNYKCISIDDTYIALNKALSDNNLIIFPNILSREVEKLETQSGGSMTSILQKVEFTFLCSEDCSTHKIVTFGEARDSTDKATNKSMTAAYKYMCIMVFAIPTEGNQDADKGGLEEAYIEYATNEQIGEIRLLLPSIDMAEEKLLVIQNVSSLEELTLTRAANVIKRLKEKQSQVPITQEQNKERLY